MIDASTRWEALDPWDIAQLMRADCGLVTPMNPGYWAIELQPAGARWHCDLTDDELAREIRGVNFALNPSWGWRDPVRRTLEQMHGELMEIAERRRSRRRKPDAQYTRENILELVRQTTGEEGRRLGKEWRFRCPFHQDKHPSLYVNEEKATWICRSQCGGGGVVDWLRRTEGTHGRRLDGGG